MTPLEQVLALFDAYKEERLQDYRKADEYLKAANDLIATHDFTDEEQAQIINARS